jgi:Skp family chaperone for outer membrane proteins
MKRLLVLVLTVFIAFTNTLAQDAKPAKKTFAWVKSTLTQIGVSPEVQTKIETFKKENDQEQKSLKESDEYKNATEQEKKNKIGALLGKRQKTIYEMLTKEQQAKVDEMREKIKKENEANGY